MDSWTRRRAAREIGHGPGRLGLQPGRPASILSNTVVEWVLADLGVLCAGGCQQRHLPDRQRLAGAVPVHRLGHARDLFVEDEEQLDKVLEVREQLPRCARIVVFDMEGLGEFNDPQVISLDALRELRAAPTMQAHPDLSSSSAAPSRASPTTWPSWSTPRAPPASPRARCTCTAR
jgi:long-chain acyl-CoA synthetase